MEPRSLPPFQTLPVKFIDTRSFFFTVGPSPSDTLCTTNLSLGSPLGSEIFACLPYAPETFGIGFALSTAFGTAAAFGEEDDESALSAESFLLSSLPQAVAVSASAGTISSAASRRRTVVLKSLEYGPATLGLRPDIPRDGQGPRTNDSYEAPGRIAQRVRIPTGDHIPAINFSTRSSTLRNGSLHSTVRCA